MNDDAVNVIRRIPVAPEPEQEEQSLLGAIGSAGLSGLGMLGNFLDLPGSMIRDVLTLNNPLDQLLSPLSHENRATGRDVLEQFGMRQNKETGWVPLEDPGEFARDTAGFFTELALDPLGWMTGWTHKGASAAVNVAVEGVQAAGRFGRAADAIGRGMNKIDPGFHIGRKVEAAYGNTIRSAAAPHIKRAAAASAAGRLKFSDWLHKYDPPVVPDAEIAKDLAKLKRHGSIGSDAEHLTQLTPVQKAVRKAAHGIGADLHYYGSANQKGRAAGVSLHDESSRIWVSGDALDGGLLAVAGHESLHLLRNSDPKAFKQLVINILEGADDGQAAIRRGAASYPGGPPPGKELEEGVAMLAGKAWEDPAFWKRIANDPSTAPAFRKSFEETMKGLTKGMTTGETKTVNEIIGDFMFGQRHAMAKGSSKSLLAEKARDAAVDRNFFAYQKGSKPFVSNAAAPPSRMSQFGSKADHIARAGVKNAIDITERIGLALQSQMNYKVHGRLTKPGQSLGRGITSGTEEMLQEFRNPVIAITDEMRQMGRLDDSMWADVQHAIEMDDFKLLPESIQAPAKNLKDTFADIHSRGINAGMKRDVINDVVDFFHREVSPEMKAAYDEAGMGVKSKGRSGSDFGVKSQISRTDLFRDFAHGTEGINEITGDLAVLDIVRRGTDGSLDAAATNMRDRFKSVVDPRLPLKDEAGYVIKDQAGNFRSMSESELFGNYNAVKPAVDMRHATDAERLAEYSQPKMYEGQFRDANGNVVTQQIELVTSVTTDYGSHVPDRFEELASFMTKKGVADRLEMDGGLFRGSAAANAVSYLQNEAYNISIAESLPKLFGEMFESDLLKPQYSGNAIRRTGASLDELFKDGNYSHLDKAVVYENIRSHSKKIDGLATAAPDDWMSYVGKSVLSPEVRDDLLQAGQFHQMPKSLEGVTNLFRSSTSLFKAGVLTAPARYTRDFISGQIANMYNNMFSFESGVRAKQILMDEPSEAIVHMKQFLEYATETGMIKSADQFTPEIATTAARRLYASLKGDASHLRRDANLEEAGKLYSDNVSAEMLAESLPGTHGSFREMGKDLLDHILFRKGSKNPIDVEGVQYFTGSRGRKGLIRREGQEGFEEFGLVGAGKILGKNADDMNRLVGWIELMRQGENAKDAFKRVTQVQLDYRPHTFGPAEQVFLKKIFPFYSFFSRQTAYLAHELITNPAGKLGKIIRLQRHADSSGGEDGQYVPEHVRSQMAVPMGDSADGGKNYLTGIGLMHEDVVSTLMGAFSDSQEAARNLISKSNPLLKGVAEYGLGRSAFQGGPLGGRDLHDMDPNVGRILTQLGIQEPTPSGQAAPVFGSRGLEFLISNSPVSRLVSSTKTALDDRKSVGERAMNLLTGMRVTTVSPEQSRRGLRDIGNAIARDAGARPFETFHISEELLEYVKEKHPEKYPALKAVDELRDEWNREQRIKRKGK